MLSSCRTRPVALITSASSGSHGVGCRAPASRTCSAPVGLEYTIAAVTCYFGAGDQPRQGREPQPVCWPVADPADLAGKHRILVPQHQEFGILGHPPPGHHPQATEQTARE
jgi:hypothetical protein